ncbi:nitrite reductase small subunit NirD [Demequina flava]|uniref:nitrite reductase small subunit NirD n=1 Tax=Demequina flava TaxID=1095025 RepID=UPI0007836651|nr:nitrite reductase small subunit NirD [Demequina flava]
MTTTASAHSTERTALADPHPTRVCALDRLTPDLGVAALVDGVQVAVFLLDDGSVHAVQNLCPFSGASVMSRGITGSRADEPTIASPIYKQVFSLLTGACLATMDKEPQPGLEGRLRVYRAWVESGEVWVDISDSH